MHRCRTVTATAPLSTIMQLFSAAARGKNAAARKCTCMSVVLGTSQAWPWPPAPRSSCRLTSSRYISWRKPRSTLLFLVSAFTLTGSLRRRAQVGFGEPQAQHAHCTCALGCTAWNLYFWHAAGALPHAFPHGYRGGLTEGVLACMHARMRLEQSCAPVPLVLFLALLPLVLSDHAHLRRLPA